MTISDHKMGAPAEVKWQKIARENEEGRERERGNTK